MPPIPPNSRVLVTGANGYIALWIVKGLLDRGFSVRGTVRSVEKKREVEETFRDYGEKLEVVIVEDITAPGAFDEAVKGVQSIAHVASPAGKPTSIDFSEAYIKPAVEGTLSILRSAKEFGHELKRIVMTSSRSAAGKEPRERAYTAADWNDEVVNLVQEKGVEAGPYKAYNASKVLAERAFWNFLKENEGQVSFDGVTILPSFTAGPVLNKAMSISVSLFIQPIESPGSPEGFLRVVGSSADVRDVADAHIEALLKQEAVGRRFIITSPSPWTPQTLYDVINAAPSLKDIKVPVGIPGSGKAVEEAHLASFDCSPLRDVLGLEQRTFEESMVDTIRNLKDNGLIREFEDGKAPEPESLIK